MGRRWLLIAGAAAAVATATSGVVSAVVFGMLPWLAPPAAALALWSLWRQRWGLASGAAVAAALPVAWTAPAAPVVPGDGGVSVLVANVLAGGDADLTARDAVIAQDADVLVLVECSPACADAYPRSIWPYRVSLDRSDPYALSVVSRHPIYRAARVEHDGPTWWDVGLQTPYGRWALLAVHSTPPFREDLAAAWSRQLATIPPPTAASLVVGDLNAAPTHPALRRLLASGWSDVRGRWTPTWPAVGPLPRWMQLDHVLIGGGLVARDVRRFTIPGSDHDGLRARVSPGPKTW